MIVLCCMIQMFQLHPSEGYWISHVTVSMYRNAVCLVPALSWLLPLPFCQGSTGFRRGSYWDVLFQDTLPKNWQSLNNFHAKSASSVREIHTAFSGALPMSLLPGQGVVALWTAKMRYCDSKSVWQVPASQIKCKWGVDKFCNTGSVELGSCSTDALSVRGNSSWSYLDFAWLLLCLLKPASKMLHYRVLTLIPHRCNNFHNLSLLSTHVNLSGKKRIVCSRWTKTVGLVYWDNEILPSSVGSCWDL